MKRFTLIALPLFLSLSVDAFAWGGNGKRPPSEPKIPAPTDTNSKTESGNGQVFVTGNFSNRNGTKELLCDIKGQVSAYRGTDSVLLTNYVDKRVVKPYREFQDTFVFDTSEGGPGYKLDKKSQQYHASCLFKGPNEDPGQIPPPHTKCDPDYEDCDWTCKASAGSPDQCQDPGQDW
ncbi:hypothetical protein [Oligoflexus tunisiensis]|uniref:hypothetical protein n=1 Tax=Oligoflexus tunisiensis TaxID=708132 RepID=UPI00114D2133|nr:hypothetical protein [Oligoflexus tunisiensis]